MKIAIITPTFNRKKLLKRLYESLLLQNDRNFEWVIVDDGSTDGTDEYVLNLKKENNNFSIKYIMQENGGKARALNHAFKVCNEVDLFVIVDSDDYLLPEGIKLIRDTANKHVDNINVGAIFFRYNDVQGNILKKKYSIVQDEMTMSRIEHDSKYLKDDGCICYFKNVIQKYKYPEFDNEYYVGPIVLQMIMGHEFQIVFTNIIVGIAEYQENGLTDLGKKLRIRNPKGMIIYCHYMQDENFRWPTRIKYGIMANAYYYVGKLTKEDLKIMWPTKLRLPYMYKIPGVLLGKYWSIKFN